MGMRLYVAYDGSPTDAMRPKRHLSIQTHRIAATGESDSTNAPDDSTARMMYNPPHESRRDARRFVERNVGILSPGFRESQPSMAGGMCEQMLASNHALPSRRYSLRARIKAFALQRARRKSCAFPRESRSDSSSFFTASGTVLVAPQWREHGDSFTTIRPHEPYPHSPGLVCAPPRP